MGCWDGERSHGNSGGSRGNERIIDWISKRAVILVCSTCGGSSICWKEGERGQKEKRKGGPARDAFERESTEGERLRGCCSMCWEGETHGEVQSRRDDSIEKSIRMRGNPTPRSCALPRQLLKAGSLRETPHGGDVHSCQIKLLMLSHLRMCHMLSAKV